MARSIEEIKTEMITIKSNQPDLIALNSKSSSAIWRLKIYIIAVAIWTLETLFDVHALEIDKKLSELKPHTPRWYRNKALAFQYGFDLLTDSDRFNNDGKTPEEIQVSKIIKYSAVTEADDQSRLIIKIATEKNNVLAPVLTPQYNAFKSYIKEFKDAGVKITIINYLPDRLRLSIRVVRDPLVLDANGLNILKGTIPVNQALNDFMKELPFDGQLSLQKLEEKLLKVEGVKDLKVDLAETSWIDSKVNDYGAWQAIDINKIPISGYFTVNLTENTPTKSTITYV